MRNIINWFKHKKQVDQPTPKDLEEARMVLESAAKPAVLGEIGGVRPEQGIAPQSCWGGRFLGKEGEGAPIDSKSGNEMQPVLQIVVHSLPMIPEHLEGVALINLWMDLKGHDFWEGTNGSGFIIREYSALDGLVPIDVATPSLLPEFPLFWTAPVMQTPSWEDFSLQVPDSVAASSNDDWFFNASLAEEFEKLQEKHPIKLGGWPTWIQGAADFEENSFVFQVDSTDKGQFQIGDAGSVYFFKTRAGWIATTDCY
ncbi:MAG: DUF1963 domain-containing protein [Rhodobacteraceae bacterium]|nr:DUF1963 domain-containing protein [Paracoccaceae bacterium]